MKIWRAYHSCNDYIAGSTPIHLGESSAEHRHSLRSKVRIPINVISDQFSKNRKHSTTMNTTGRNLVGHKSLRGNNLPQFYRGHGAANFGNWGTVENLGVIKRSLQSKPESSRKNSFRKKNSPKKCSKTKMQWSETKLWILKESIFTKRIGT